MFRDILSIIDNGGDLEGLTRTQWINKLSNGDYPGIYDYFVRFGAGNMQHEQMAAHYRETIARVLQEFDTGVAVPDNQQPQQLYLDLAWEGLIYENGSNAIQSWISLSQQERDRIEGVIENYITNNINETCTE